jgi:hypothetical protein
LKVKCRPKRERVKSDNSLVEWKECAPFVVNPRGVLIHRARAVVTYHVNGRIRHSHVDYWCDGGCCFDTSDTNIFVTDPPESRILCARCEAKAVDAGERPAAEIAGRHVHTGGVRAYRTCCQDLPN